MRSTALEPPLEWDDIEAPEDMRKFVTFVNPSLAKGSMLFARLADMLDDEGTILARNRVCHKHRAQQLQHDCGHGRCRRSDITVN